VGVAAVLGAAWDFRLRLVGSILTGIRTSIQDESSFHPDW
jgi:hypothetical protein